MPPSLVTDRRLQLLHQHADDVEEEDEVELEQTEEHEYRHEYSKQQHFNIIGVIAINKTEGKTERPTRKEFPFSNG